MRRARNGLWLPTTPGGWSALFTFAIFGAMVCVTGYFAVQEIDDDAGRLSAASPAADVPVANAHVAPANESGDLALFAKPIEPDHAAPPESLPIPQLPAPRLPPPNLSLRKPAVDSRIANAGLSPADSRSPERIGQSDAVTISSAASDSAPVAANIARAAIPEEPPVPDRWQALNAALARCSRENLLASAVCAERARLQYCDGFWGEVAQCRGTNRPDNSR